MSISSKLFLLLLLFGLMATARADGIFNSPTRVWGWQGQGIFNPGGAAAPPLIGALLLEDNASFFLLEDNLSHLCFEGGAC
jgi:hypothetical protein